MFSFSPLAKTRAKQTFLIALSLHDENFFFLFLKNNNFFIEKIIQNFCGDFEKAFKEIEIFLLTDNNNQQQKVIIEKKIVENKKNFKNHTPQQQTEKNNFNNNNNNNSVEIFLKSITFLNTVHSYFATKLDINYIKNNDNDNKKKIMKI
jgi:hypothetical protein